MKCRTVVVSVVLLVCVCRTGRVFTQQSDGHETEEDSHEMKKPKEVPKKTIEWKTEVEHKKYSHAEKPEHQKSTTTTEPPPTKPPPPKPTTTSAPTTTKPTKKKKQDHEKPEPKPTTTTTTTPKPPTTTTEAPHEMEEPTLEPEEHSTEEPKSRDDWRGHRYKSKHPHKYGTKFLHKKSDEQHKDGEDGEEKSHPKRWRIHKHGDW